jgi:hypothetical protein
MMTGRLKKNTSQRKEHQLNLARHQKQNQNLAGKQEILVKRNLRKTDQRKNEEESRERRGLVRLKMKCPAHQRGQQEEQELNGKAMVCFIC